MSRSNVKPQTNSGKTPSKPAPTAWKDRLTAEDYVELRYAVDVFD